VNSSDASHFLIWKQQKLLARHIPPDVQRFPAQYKDSDGYYAVWRASLSVMGYNTKLVAPQEAPTGYLDLLDPKWKGKLVKSHPGYSGTSLTGTYAIAKLLGWDYLEKLSKQGVQQLQSTTASPKSIASGERAVMVDGNEYNMLIEIDAKSPVKIIYPKEGTPFVTSPTAIFADAPHPNAARVLQNFLYTAKTQQLLVNEGGLRSVHPDTRARGSHAAQRYQAAGRRSGGCFRRSRKSRSATRRCSATRAGLTMGPGADAGASPPGAAPSRVRTDARSGSLDWTAPFSAAIVLLLAVLVLLPLFWIAVTSMQVDAKGFTLAHYRHLF
jgi:ABC-type Fe3+ transport system substrate-binding protein